MDAGSSTHGIRYQLAHLHDDRRNQVIALNATLLVLGNVSVALRLFAKRLQRARMQVDDYLMLLAVVCRPSCLSANIAPKANPWTVFRNRSL